MKVEDDFQKAASIISEGATPLTHAKDAAIFLTSCPLGIDPGHASSIVLQILKEMEGLFKICTCSWVQNNAVPSLLSLVLLI